MEFLSRLKFPNPLNPSAIEFTSSDDCTVSLKLFDDRGNELQTILDGSKFQPGTHQVMLDPLSLPAGKYLYRFTVLGTGGEVIETKMFERII